MDKSQFTANSPGKLVHITVPAPDWAFIPDPLPLDWEMPAVLWPLLVRARESLGRLDGVGRHMPNHRLLLRPLQYREALRSSSLEGTYATPEELLLYEIDPREPTSKNDPVNAWREVFNYDAALQLGQSLLNGELPLSLRLMRRMHETLLGGVRGNDRSPGEFRRHQVHIGSDRRFVPPPPNEVPACLDVFERHLHEVSQLDSLVRCFMVHYQFEAIHPFSDGNGRVGRLLLSLMIYQWCKLGSPWLYLSPFFDRYKDEYINGLFRVSTHGDWTGWIEFCLKGTVEQAEDAIKRFNQLVILRDKYHQQIAEEGGSARLQQIVEGLLEQPAVTIPQLAKRYDVTYPTAQADIERLIKLGILKPLDHQGRPKLFFAEQIIQIAHGENPA